MAFSEFSRKAQRDKINHQFHKKYADFEDFLENARTEIQLYIYIYTLYLATLAPTTTKVGFHGGRRYKKYYKEYKKEGN